MQPKMDITVRNEHRCIKSEHMCNIYIMQTTFTVPGN